MGIDINKTILNYEQNKYVTTCTIIIVFILPKHLSIRTKNWRSHILGCWNIP